MQIFSKHIHKYVQWGSRHDSAAEDEGSPCCKATQKALSGGETMANTVSFGIQGEKVDNPSWSLKF